MDEHATPPDGGAAAGSDLKLLPAVRVGPGQHRTARLARGHGHLLLKALGDTSAAPIERLKQIREVFHRMGHQVVVRHAQDVDQLQRTSDIGHRTSAMSITQLGTRLSRCRQITKVSRLPMSLQRSVREYPSTGREGAHHLGMRTATTFTMLLRRAPSAWRHQLQCVAEELVSRS